MNKKIISTLLLIIGFTLGASALSAIAAWTAPTQAPPNCTSGQPGCDAPVNVSSSLQSKLGPLIINAGSILDDIGLTVVGKIKLDDVRKGAGKVLTSDANGVGTWQDPVAVTSGGSGSIITCTKEVNLGGVGGGIRYGTFSFLASDCGGVLPDSSYIGAVRSIHDARRDGNNTSPVEIILNNFKLLNAGEASGPGMRYSITGGSGMIAEFSAVYMKPGLGGSSAAPVAGMKVYTNTSNSDQDYTWTVPAGVTKITVEAQGYRNGSSADRYPFVRSVKTVSGGTNCSIHLTRSQWTSGPELITQMTCGGTNIVGSGVERSNGLSYGDEIINISNYEYGPTTSYIRIIYSN